jgi:hypothetical protein
MPVHVKPKPLIGGVFAAQAGIGADCEGHPGESCVEPIIVLLLLALLAGMALLLRRRGPGPRERAVAELLDAADALEARLRQARAEIEAIAGDDANPVREAMQEMLRQRLWLQQHGGEASLEQLAGVRASIDAARGRLEQMLAQVERARASVH